MKIIIHAEYECITGIEVRRPAVVKIGEAILTSVIPRDSIERDIINLSLNQAAEREEAKIEGAKLGYGG